MICLLLHLQSTATKRNQIAQILNKEWSLAWGNHGCVWLTAAVLPQTAWHFWMTDLKFDWQWQSFMICLLLHSQSNATKSIQIAQILNKELSLEWGNYGCAWWLTAAVLPQPAWHYYWMTDLKFDCKDDICAGTKNTKSWKWGSQHSLISSCKNGWLCKQKCITSPSGWCKSSDGV